MQQTTIAGHSLRSILITAPTVLIPFGFILDALHSATGDEDYAKASYMSMTGGVIGGLAASMVGAIDFSGEKPHGQLKRDGQIRAALTGAAMLANAANLILRRKGHHDSGGSVFLSALAATGTLASRWYDDRVEADRAAAERAGPEGVSTQQDVRIDHSAPEVEQYVAAGPATDTHPPR
jgi:uncharacterized membrane protein